jgi:hypothetical protein
MKKPNNRKVKEDGLTIYLHTTFTLIHEENAQRIAYAISRGGYLTRITVTNGSFVVHVFRHNK